MNPLDVASAVSVIGIWIGLLVTVSDFRNLWKRRIEAPLLKRDLRSIA